MAKVIGTSASFTDLTIKLREHHAYVPDDVQGILGYQTFYNDKISQREELIEAEKFKLLEELTSLQIAKKNIQEEIKSGMIEKEEELLLKRDRLRALLEESQESQGWFQDLADKTKTWVTKRRLYPLENNFEREVQRPFRVLEREKAKLEDKKDYLKDNFEQVTNERVDGLLARFEKTKVILEENKSLIAGMIGEDKAIAELSKLPDSFTVINDLRISFDKGYQRNKDGDHISSIQIDHLIIGPPGIFVVETKHWSQESIENRDIDSPVQHVIRSGDVLKRYTQVKLIQMHDDRWGTNKIPFRNIILMTDAPFLKSHEKVEFHHFSTFKDSIQERSMNLTNEEVNLVVDFFKD